MPSCSSRLFEKETEKSRTINVVCDGGMDDDGDDGDDDDHAATTKGRRRTEEGTKALSYSLRSFNSVCLNSRSSISGSSGNKNDVSKGCSKRVLSLLPGLKTIITTTTTTTSLTTRGKKVPKILTTKMA